MNERTEEAMRQLRELAIDGYPVKWLAQQTLVSECTLLAVRAGRRKVIQYDVAEAIADAYNAFHGTDPLSRGISDRAVCNSHSTANRHGWTRATVAAAGHHRLYERPLARAHALAEAWAGDSTPITRDQAAALLNEVLDTRGWTETSQATPKLTVVADRSTS